MWLLDLLKKKNNSELKKEDFVELTAIIARSFDKAKETDDKLSQKLDHLYIKHETLQGKHDKNLTLMLSWFEHFQNNHNEHEKNMNSLKNSLSEMEIKLKKVELIDEEFIKNIVEKYVIMPNEDKDDLEKELFEELTNIRETGKEVKTITKEIQTILTKSELELLSILYNTNLPLSYVDLGHKVRKSPSTVKVYLNALKNKGIGLEEHNAPRGIKLYSITNKEKIKKFYNLG